MKYVCISSQGEYEVEADSAAKAAQAYVDETEWGESPKTRWVTVSVDGDDYTVPIQATQPQSMCGCKHKWRHIADVGSGGGVLIVDYCDACHGTRITNSWATDPVTGKQGLVSTEYVEESHEE